MKQVEKMASEYALHIKATDSPDCDPVNVAHDWQQGFRAARELAAKVCDPGDGSMCSMAEATWGEAFRDRIRQLGEGEA